MAKPVISVWVCFSICTSLFRKKVTDFQKAITLLLINAQKRFWYRWNCLGMFSSTNRISWAFDEHANKHTDIKEDTHTNASAEVLYSEIYRAASCES